VTENRFLYFCNDKNQRFSIVKQLKMVSLTSIFLLTFVILKTSTLPLFISSWHTTGIVQYTLNYDLNYEHFRLSFTLLLRQKREKKTRFVKSRDLGGHKFLLINFSFSSKFTWMKGSFNTKASYFGNWE
jgi:hypothetical protein